MKSCLFVLALILGFSRPSLALDTSLKTKLLQEVDYIGSLYSSAYAPKAWKEKHLGWDLDLQVALAKAKVQSATNLYEARAAVAELLNSTADYHVGFAFFSTERSSLPFTVKTVEGKTLIVYIDRTKLSETAFPYSVGDEILTINQVPVAAELDMVRKSVGKNVDSTDRALADLNLTSRQRARTYEVPRGPVMVSVKRAADDFVGTVQLAWDYTPEKLKNTFSTSFSFEKKPVLDLPMMQTLQLADLQDTNNPYGLGGRDSFLPEFGAKIWETAADNTFQAYIYQNEEGKMVGVLRIPSYSPTDVPKAVKDFAGIIQRMQKFTSALVIDQNNNPGGSVFYLYTLVSMLTEQAAVVPKHRVSLLASDIAGDLNVLTQLESVKTEEEAQKVLGGDNLHGYPVTFQLAMAIRDHLNFVMDEYKTGKQLSNPTVLWGVEKINPHKNAVYTKPVVILVNALDFSGGDFFPAILQDNKRVTVVGTRTAGAGGYVLQVNFPNNLGLSRLSFTGSIAERVDLSPIENLGVTPDVELAITVEDIRKGYGPYLKAVKEIIKAQIK